MLDVIAGQKLCVCDCVYQGGTKHNHIETCNPAWGCGLFCPWYLPPGHSPNKPPTDNFPWTFSPQTLPPDASWSSQSVCCLWNCSSGWKFWHIKVCMYGLHLIHFDCLCPELAGPWVFRIFYQVTVIFPLTWWGKFSPNLPLPPFPSLPVTSLMAGARSVGVIRICQQVQVERGR